MAETLEIHPNELPPNLKRMGTLVVARVAKDKFKIQSVDARTRTQQDELRMKLAEDFGKSLVEINVLDKSANDRAAF